MLDGGGLLALGGSEASCGYKGYGLAMLVEVFCGILAGAEFGPRIRFWKETNRIANLVSSFVPQGCYVLCLGLFIGLTASTMTLKITDECS